MVQKKENKFINILGFSLLLIMYMSAAVLTVFVARDQSVITIFGGEMRVTQFTGVISTVANACLIFLVVLFNKPGFITSVLIIMVQFPTIILSIFKAGTLSSIPGFFSNFFTLITIIMIYTRSRKIKKYQESEVEYLKEQQKLSERLFEQTATALVNAIDAKDTYSHGHSLRVAEYSEKIARRMGKSEEEIRKIYYSALLHDVGKIGIDDSIINKNGKLTAEEYDVIKQHPSMGNQILASISEYPYLSLGAHYHHERYDGKGYPDGLKGDDIPEIARIISVADSYDAMTSTRSYREALPQPLVREEIVKGSGTQFDPEIARIMQRMIDEDFEYMMRERRAVKEFSWKNGLDCDGYKSMVSDSVLMVPAICKMRLKLELDKIQGEESGCCIVFFDASDGRVHTTERAIEEMSYFEFFILWLDGRIENLNCREIQSSVKEETESTDLEEGEYEICGVKVRDHMLVTVNDGKTIMEHIIALPDSQRFVYAALTGKHCHVYDTHLDRGQEFVPKDYIPRIAPEISYIDVPAGDIPNIQIDSYRTDSTEGIEVVDGMQFTFHMMSLPTAKLIWHCAYIVLFYSADKNVNGAGYCEYAFVRLDGEHWDNAGKAKNELIVRDDEFVGWNKWKEENKKGVDCVVTFERKGNRVTVRSKNQGLEIENTTVLMEEPIHLYAAITGDQCAITNIQIKK